jgi:hypothetical protein
MGAIKMAKSDKYIQSAQGLGARIQPLVSYVGSALFPSISHGNVASSCCICVAHIMSMSFCDFSRVWCCIFGRERAEALSYVPRAQTNVPICRSVLVGGVACLNRFW